MKLVFLETQVAKVLQQIKDLSFCELLRKCREALGLMQCKAAHLAGLTANRLKNLELGLFGVLPSDCELKPLAALYGIKFDILKGKASEYVRSRAKKTNLPMSCV